MKRIVAAKILIAIAVGVSLTALAYKFFGDIAIIIASILSLLTLTAWFYLWRP